jgi:hypothetical protein
MIFTTFVINFVSSLANSSMLRRFHCCWTVKNVDRKHFLNVGTFRKIYTV